MFGNVFRRNKLPTHGDNVQGCVSRGKTRDGYWVTVCTHYKDLQHVEHAVGGKRACFGTNCVTHQHRYQLRLNKARQECQIQQAKTTFHGKMRRAQGGGAGCVFQTKGAALGEVELHPAVFS